MISVRGLGVALGGRRLFGGVDFSVAPGRCLAIVGPSGGGKTQLLLALLRLHPDAVVVGDVALSGAGGDPRTWRGRHAGLVLQEPLLALDPMWRVGDSIAEVGGNPEVALRAVGLDPALATRHPHALSGGQRQRVAVALALAYDPPLLLLDEPTAALDGDARDALLELLRSRRAGRATVVVTHDPTVATALADEIRPLEDGTLGAPIDLTPRALPAPPDAPGGLRLSVRGLRVRRANAQVLAGVDLDLHDGELLGLAGPSGSGKSSLLAALLRRIPSEGTIQLGGSPLPAALSGSARRAMQLVPQDPRAALDPRWSVRAHLAEVGDDGGILVRVGLDRALLDHRPGQLSGGQAQRVVIARALALRPQLILLDEALSAVDPARRAALVSLLHQLNAAGTALVLVSHDRAMLDRVCHRVLQLSDGRLEAQNHRPRNEAPFTPTSRTLLPRDKERTMGSASFKSVVEMFHHRVRSTPDTDAFYHRVNGQWQTMMWRTVGERARAMACGLRSLGLQNEERVSLFSATRVEWIIADMGILCAAGATTTIYPSNTPDEAEFIINNSGSVIVICDTDKQVAKLQSVREKIPGLKHVVCMDGGSSPDGWVMGLDDLEAKGKAWDAANPGEYDRVADAVGPESLATLMYTSGTTGNPKGVMLTHDCWVYEGEAIDSVGLLSPADKQFLFLPLSHSFAKVLESAIIRIGVPTAVDGDLTGLVENLANQTPTFMAGVPRIFEKVYNKIVTKAKDGGGLKLKIFQWAFGVGKEASALRQKGQEPGGFLAFKVSIADKLVFSKIKATFGGRIRFFISGGAPLSPEIAAFFHAADILICEGYGLTETSAASFVNRPDKYRFGTVGHPLPGTEVKIAEDGEILIRGRGVMRGYYNLPEQTAETLKDGWLYTGDIGQLEDGFLRITDRKKDLIKTSGGKYVAPQELEGKLKVRCTILAQALVHGNNRNFCSLLVTLAEDSVKSFYGQNGMNWLSYEEATKNEKVLAEVAAQVESLNKELPSYATLKKFAILPLDLTQEEGDLTPSLKVKRKTVEAKYKHILDGFYAGASADL